MDKTSIKKTIAGAILVTAGLVGLEHILNDGQTQTEPLKRSQTIATTPELKVQRYQIKDIPHYEESLWTTYLEAEKDIRTKFGLENKDHDLNKAQNFADTFSKDVSRAVMKSANAKNPVAAAQKNITTKTHANNGRSFKKKKCCMYNIRINLRYV